MTQTYTISDVTDDLRFMVTSLTELFAIDDEGFWIDASTREHVVHKLDAKDPGKKIVLFQDNLPRGDYYYFNPYSEALGRKTPATALFYKMMRISFNVRLMTSLLYMSSQVLASKTADTGDTSFTLSHAAVRISSVPVGKKTFFDLVDDEMIKEFKTLSTRMGDDLLNVPYYKSERTAHVTCELITDTTTWDEKYGKDIRKRTLPVFKAVIMGLLGITDVEGLKPFSVTYDPDSKTSAKLYTTLGVYLKLYGRFNDILARAYSTDSSDPNFGEIDLDDFQAVIERLPLAHVIAKHMVQPSVPKDLVDNASQQAPSLQMGSGFVPHGTSRFSGPEVVDAFGNRSRPGTAAPLRIGTAPPAAQPRFKPHVVSETPADPFAPATRQVAGGGNGFNSGYGASTGSYFGNNTGMSMGGGSFNSFVPSNFGSPQTTRRYF